MREILILLSCGSMGYVWLCAVVASLVRAVRSITRGATGNAWMALALAIGAALLWTVIVAAAILLAMTVEPGAGLALVGSQWFWPAIGSGAVVWLLQLAATRRVPAFGDDFDEATAGTVRAFCGSLVLRSGSRSGHRLAPRARAV